MSRKLLAIVLSVLLIFPVQTTNIRVEGEDSNDDRFLIDHHLKQAGFLSICFINVLM